VTAYREIPPEVRSTVLGRADGVCEDCQEFRKLELHHLRYWTNDPWRESIRGRETPDDLAALCRECHHERHLDPSGQFWMDPEEADALWETWHASMDQWP
jgi:5-methylcytosine-specific restriction endonuclease McrA